MNSFSRTGLFPCEYQHYWDQKEYSKQGYEDDTLPRFVSCQSPWEGTRSIDRFPQRSYLQFSIISSLSSIYASLIFCKRIPCWSSGMTAFSESTVPEWSSWDSALLTDSTGLSDMGATELLEDNRNRTLSTWLGLI